MLLPSRADRYRDISRRSARKRKAEGKPPHPDSLKIKPYGLKVKAQRLLQAAIRLGWCVRPPCEGCGTLENVQAHHRDYTKPYDVDWLCGLCHAAEHRGELVKRGPKAPPIQLTRPCSKCGKDASRREMTNKDLCIGCSVSWRRCSICKDVKTVGSFSGTDRRCKPCNAARVAARS